MPTTVIDPLRPAGAGWGWLLAYGILSVVLGIAAFLWPFSATFAASVIIGVFFIASGIVSIGAGLFAGPRESRAYAILFGVASLLIGGILAFDPLSGALSLTILVAIWLGVRGVMEIVAGARYRAHRALMIVLGIVNVILALLVLATISWSALVIPGYILGISFLLAGGVEVARAVNHRKGAAAFAV